ncbi:hypothetical protein DSM3645_16960 [Blastopirellula marina DSM 3645]|uniref:Uncharacterized protein n=1 Tax=Blastopirellula marina DSM 3645 TaxID=314230 RepID=A3ZNG7_9BACT|nr:hypothetical protein DSM3645_16960 [Blastopirellula marina DSM 3645]
MMLSGNTEAAREVQQDIFKACEGLRLGRLTTVHYGFGTDAASMWIVA